MFGGNDGQPIQDADGKLLPGRASRAGRSEYGKRVGAVMDQLGKEGRRVVWVGSPIATSANFNKRLKIINQVHRAAGGDPALGRRYVDAWDAVRRPTGPSPPR